MDTREIQRIITDYYKQPYANKADDLEEMDKFLEKYNLPRLNQDKRENMNRPIIRTEIETMIKKLPTGVPVVAQWLTNPTRNHEVAGSVPGPGTSTCKEHGQNQTNPATTMSSPHCISTWQTIASHPFPQWKLLEVSSVSAGPHPQPPRCIPGMRWGPGGNRGQVNVTEWGGGGWE